MKAKLKSLSGKYYGTIIELSSDEFGDDVEFANDIKIWISGGDPSARQCQQWAADAAGEFRGDGHYESTQSYTVATAIVAAINND